MKTTIDNNQRVFLITGDMGQKVFCNLKDIPKALKTFQDKDGVNIQHLWNYSLKRASKKMLNNMFKGAGMKFRVI